MKLMIIPVMVKILTRSANMSVATESDNTFTNKHISEESDSSNTDKLIEMTLSQIFIEKHYRRPVLYGLYIHIQYKIESLQLT